VGKKVFANYISEEEFTSRPRGPGVAGVETGRKDLRTPHLGRDIFLEGKRGMDSEGVLPGGKRAISTLRKGDPCSNRACLLP